MKKVMISFLALTLLAPALSSARHDDWKPPHGWHHGDDERPPPGWRHGDGWRPDGPRRLFILPAAAAAVIIGGLTYYILDGSYYQRQYDNTYLVVDPPVDRVGTMRRLDYNGERFYVQGGHFYRRDIHGQYYEVPRPAGL
ncbi:DUF6515 family protein [Erwinia piriflorinigrans]|uniref:Uncharacterized protein n=1 Tax=Erwinia piriflorinigrans CFBP 5888 TaxID=1161919 RepID=V5Z859_9GAMM|nr:DUF6515 family protein [Erwinia piriflorinigrans]CCG87145.1 hypothetical protein EPIR_1780 [Erwinia piriflorinigrans CFBP 5888]